MSDNWDTDPFDGEISFDSDYESDSKKNGLIKSFAIGFLGGVGDSLAGNTDAKIKTIQTALPKSFSGSFKFLNDTRVLYNEISEEVKKNIAPAMKDIQDIIGNRRDKIDANSPDFVKGKIDQFSKYDFSQWEGYKESGTTSEKVGTATDEEVNEMVGATRDASLLTLNGLKSLGGDIVNSMVAIGAGQNASLSVLNSGIAKSNAYLKQLVDYQLKVQHRNDTMKINLLARMHITNAKFYKFMESSNHAMMREFKEMVKYSKKSDFEKMSYSDEVRKRVRKTFFNTARSGLGGIGGLVNDRLGKYARENGYNTLNQ